MWEFSFSAVLVMAQPKHQVQVSPLLLVSPRLVVIAFQYLVREEDT